MSGIDIRRSPRKKRWMFDSFQRIKCSSRAGFEPHPLLTKSSFDSRPSCVTDDTSQQSSHHNMEECSRWPASHRMTAKNTARKTLFYLDESGSKRNGHSTARSSSEDVCQKDVVVRSFVTAVKNGSERTVTTYEMLEEEEDHSGDTETELSHPSLLQEATLQLTNARAWLHKWEAAKQSSLHNESCDISPTSSASYGSTARASSREACARRVPSRLVVQSKAVQEEDSECTCSLIHSELPQDCFVRSRTRNHRSNGSSVMCTQDADGDSWCSRQPVTLAPQQDDDDSLFQSVIQGASALPYNFDEYWGDIDDSFEPPLVMRSRTVDEGDWSPPRQQQYECRPPSALYPWRSRESLQNRLLSEETVLDMPQLPNTNLVSRPSSLTILQRNASDPLHQSRPTPMHQRSRSDPVFSFRKDVLADETEGGQEDDDFCDWNGNLGRISQDMPDVFTGNRLDDISTIGGEDLYQTSSHDGDDERFSLTRQESHVLSYKRRGPVLSWFHQGSRTTASRLDGYYPNLIETKPVLIPRSSRRMLDEADWSLDVPRRLSKTECEI